MDNQDEQSKITINGVEYDPSEAQSLIELGNKTREVEQKYNTSFDRVYPEYTRTTQRLKELETELQETRDKLKTTPTSEGNPQGASSQGLTQDQKEAARRLGVVFDEDIKSRGYLTKDEARELFKQEQERAEALKEDTQRILRQADDLEKKLTGADGRPAFRRDLIMSYAYANKIPNLEEAYNKAYAPELESWKQAQIEASKKPSLKTLRGGGAKNPPDVKINRDNVKDLLHEALYSPEE